MIARIWRGNTRADHAAEYGEVLERTGFAEIRATPGNRGLLLLRGSGDGTAEFMLISFWEDFEAIRRFAGPEPEKAVYYPEDEGYLLGKEPHVSHYEVAPGSLPELARLLQAREVAKGA